MIFTVTEDVLMFPQTVFPGREDDVRKPVIKMKTVRNAGELILSNKGEGWGI